MPYSVALHDCFDRVDPLAWSRIVAPHDLAMDLRLLSAFQRTMTAQCRCGALFSRDDAAHPIPAAALALFPGDGADTTSPLNRGLTRRIRNAAPNFLRF